MSGTARDLKRRLKSVVATQQMTKAMKTVAVAKYNKTLAVTQKFDEYASQCRHLLASLGNNYAEESAAIKNERVCYVLVTGNRGLCGMYNLEIVRYLQELIQKETRKVFLVICGKYGASVRESFAGAEILQCVELADIPEYCSARGLYDYLCELYSSGQVDEVSFVCQKFKNVLVQTPSVQQIFPAVPEKNEDESVVDYMFLPGREEIFDGLLTLCASAAVYRILLDCAMGVHGATLTAMRTAADNSAEMYNELSLTLNRMRQMAATTEVIELSGSAAARED